MKYLNILALLTAICLPDWAGAQLRLLPGKEPSRAFPGEIKVMTTWQNIDYETLTVEIRARIFQTSSATAVELSETNWKTLQVLPGQTILESARLDFPAVKAKTKFVVQWLENSNHVFGTTEVWVYPTNLLEELRPLSDDKAIGVFDPQNEIKPLLKRSQVDFVDLENLDLENFSGKLAIIGLFQSAHQIPDGLDNQIKKLAKQNVAIVWIQPPPEKPEKLQPSFYSIPERQSAVVIAQANLVSDLPENPQSQLNLIYFCKLALNPQPMALPFSTYQH